MHDAPMIVPDFSGIVRDLRVRSLAVGADAVGDISRLDGGHSGFTYLVHPAVGARTLVLRLSPPGARIVGPSDVGRQGRIMRAARAAGIPTPQVVDCSSDPVIDGRAFVLMHWEEGIAWDRAPGLTQQDIAAQAAAMALRIGAVTPSRSGIDGEVCLSPTDEVGRWAALLPRCPDWLQQPAQRLLAELADDAPPPGPARLVHGDFHYGNLLFQDGQISSVVDWEIAGLGDPLFDLGSLAVASLRRRYHPEPNPTGSIDVSAEELAALYKVPFMTFRWFVAASCLKYAAILGYNYGLHRRGKRIDPVYDSLVETMRGLVDEGAQILNVR